LEVEEFISKVPSIDYVGFSKKWVDEGWTPIYEWCSNKSRIVLEYNQDCLSLIAIRNIRTGLYIPFLEMAAIAKASGIPLVKAWTPEELHLDLNTDLKTFHNFYASIQKQRGFEGFVLRFDSGFMLKIKTHWYFQLNKALDLVKNPKNERHRWECILEEKYDDLRGFLKEDDRQAMDDFARAIAANIEASAKSILDLVVNYRRNHQRKEFAGFVNSHKKAEKGIMFSVYGMLDDWEKKNIPFNEQNALQETKKMIVKTLLNVIQAKNKFEELRGLAGGIHFKDFVKHKDNK
jgi:RNA ligase